MGQPAMGLENGVERVRLPCANATAPSRTSQEHGSPRDGLTVAENSQQCGWQHIGGVVRIGAVRADWHAGKFLRRSSCPQPRKLLPQPRRLPPQSKRPPPAAKKAAAPLKAAPAKGAPQATITLKQIGAELAEGHDLPKKQVEAMLGDLVAFTTRDLKKGDKIRLTGLGILQVRARPARMGRNPATGEAIKIKASRKIAFRAAKELKEAV